MSTPEKTEPLPQQPDARQIEPPQLLAACAQSIGRQREHNEDSVFMLTSVLSSGQAQIPVGLYIVADGMGGHHHGEVASEIAVKALSSHIVRRLFLPLINPKGVPPEESIQEILRDGVMEAHRLIVKEVNGGGTTLTAALVMGEQLTLAHVGDSRAYLIAPGEEMHPLTRDHSLVKRLEELGQITSEEAAVHPQRNVLYRALGQGDPFEADISTSPIPHAASLLLCSDGLWGVIPESDILKTIRSTTNLQDACQKMIDLANQAGGPDNITAVLVRMPDATAE